jgi:predicted nucleotide-binding protein
VAWNEYRKWTDYNEELLRQQFSNDDPAKEYSCSPGYGVIQMEPLTRTEDQELHDDIREKIHLLESLSERLDLIPLSDELGLSSSANEPHTVAAATDRVFVVHGHDNEVRESVARFIEKLGLQAVILHEQPNEGLTIIEKLESHSDVRYAVILLTPDDEGREAGSKEPLKARARQNVVLEFGYFIGRLGRSRVCALHRGSIEIPSDYLGVVYVPLDDDGAWRLRLARELKATGFPIDMNRAL